MNADLHTWAWGLGWLAVTGLVFALPLWPAWRELRQRSDAEPLAIDSHDDGRTSYRARMAMPHLQPLETLPASQRWPQVKDSSVLAREPVTLHDGERAKRLVSSSDVTLQARSRISRALHARRVLSQGSRLPPLVSAENAIVLAPGSVFLRLTAPLIQTLAPGQSQPAAVPPERTPAPAPETVSERHFHSGHLIIDAGQQLRTHLVVRGELTLAEGACVTGHIKVHGDVRLAPGARVQGALFATGNIECEADNRAHGPMCAGGEVYLGPGFVGGHAKRPCSISGLRVSMAPGVRVHGSVATFSSGEVVE